MLLDAAGRRLLIGSLADVPEHVYPLHALATGRGRAWAAGPPSHPSAVLVEHEALPGEPFGYGDPDALCNLLQQVDGWTCVLVPLDLAIPLTGRIERATGGGIRSFEDVGYVLHSAPSLPSDPSVRLVGPEDRTLLQTVPADWYPGGFHIVEGALARRLVAVAIHDGRVVAEASSLAHTATYADIGVMTLEPYRRRGLATAAAAMVARELISRGLRPVWSTSEHNVASRRLAAKLGFTEASRLVYLIPDR